MRKFAIAIAAVISMTSVAHADWNGHRHHPPRHHYHGGGGNNWVAPLVGGMIIGGLFMNAQQNNYYRPQPQPECQNVYMGSFWNGFRWVKQYQVVCNNYDW